MAKAVKKKAPKKESG